MPNQKKRSIHSNWLPAFEKKLCYNIDDAVCSQPNIQNKKTEYWMLYVSKNKKIKKYAVDLRVTKINKKKKSEKEWAVTHLTKPTNTHKPFAKCPFYLNSNGMHIYVDVYYTHSHKRTHLFICITLYYTTHDQRTGFEKKMHCITLRISVQHVCDMWTSNRANQENCWSSQTYNKDRVKGRHRTMMSWGSTRTRTVKHTNTHMLIV